MRVAFYAPLKSPMHPMPSGDRRMGQLLMSALSRGGHCVQLASTFRSYDGHGNRTRQQRLQSIGKMIAARLVRRYLNLPADSRPQAWFTYHLYHKAPDWLGPKVAKALGIPYVLAEASHAPKQANGPWVDGHAAAAAAIAAADIVFGLNSSDTECLRSVLSPRAGMVPLKPFIETDPFISASSQRRAHRSALVNDHGLPPDVPWLLTVAMMRSGDKCASYEVLGRALTAAMSRPWRLIVAGDGPARDSVRRYLASLGARVVFVGALDHEKLLAIYAASDLYLWPAINEAYGMTFLEAQAAGLPVVAGRTGGVPDVVSEPECGILTPPGDAEAFARAVTELIGNPARLRHMGTSAQRRMVTRHDIAVAARLLHATLATLTRDVPKEADGRC